MPNYSLDIQIDNRSLVDSGMHELDHADMRIFLCSFLFFANSSAVAQDISPVSCWIADLRFSPGIVVRNGNRVAVCSPTGEWTDSDYSPLGCITEGSLFGTGAIKSFSRGEFDIGIECQPDGTWKNLGPSAKPVNNCYYDGKEFSVGAVYLFPKGDTKLKLECQDNGSWVSLENKN